MTANCSSPVKIVLVNVVAEVVSDLDSDEFIFQWEDKDFDIDDEITGEDAGLNCIRPATSTYPLLVVPCPS